MIECMKECMNERVSETMNESEKKEIFGTEEVLVD